MIRHSILRMIGFAFDPWTGDRLHPSRSELLSGRDQDMSMAFRAGFQMAKGLYQETVLSDIENGVDQTRVLN